MRHLLMLLTTFGGLILSGVPAMARPITFLYESTVSMTRIGGPPLVPVSLRYTFDSETPDEADDPRLGVYGQPIFGSVTVGAERITFTSAPDTVLLVADDLFKGTDDYGLLVNDPGSIQGTIAGFPVVHFQFNFEDGQGRMLSSDRLPLTTDFAARSLYADISLRLFDPANPTVPDLYIGGLNGPFTFTALQATTPVVEPSGGLLFGLGLALLLGRSLTGRSRGLLPAPRAYRDCAPG